MQDCYLLLIIETSQRKKIMIQTLENLYNTDSYKLKAILQNEVDKIKSDQIFQNM